jgi:hypothetical protein
VSLENGAMLKKKSTTKAQRRLGCASSLPPATIVSAERFSIREASVQGRIPHECFLVIVSRMSSNNTHFGKLAPIWRALVEVGFIVFLFYSNLLMGEFTRTNQPGKSLAFAIQDIFTFTNFVIAIISGLIGYVVVEFLRKRV